MYYQDLKNIHGKDMSDSHSVYLFLKKISNPDYETSVIFLQKSGADLDDCLRSLRKT